MPLIFTMDILPAMTDLTASEATSPMTSIIDVQEGSADTQAPEASVRGIVNFLDRLPDGFSHAPLSRHPRTGWVWAHGQELIRDSDKKKFWHCKLYV